MGVRNFCDRDGLNAILEQCLTYGYTVETQPIGSTGPVGPSYGELTLRQSHVYSQTGILCFILTERVERIVDLTGAGDHLICIHVDIDVS